MDDNKKECTMGLIVGVAIVIILLAIIFTLKSCAVDLEKARTERIKIQLQSEVVDKSTEIKKEK